MTASVLPVWWDDAADGPTNMAADELLAEEAERHGGLVIRLYSWCEPTISLGGFQRLDDARGCAAIAGLPLVRRPSGGGAIVHGTDLTYAAAVPRSHRLGASPQAFYDSLHEAMVAVLRGLGFDAGLHAPAADDPPADALLCFSRRAPGDVVVQSSTGRMAAKVMGSAQRRLGTTVLQHGSLLFRSCPAVAAEARHPGLDDLAAAAHPRTPRTVADDWTAALARALGIVRELRSESFRQIHRAAVAAGAARFRDNRWTGRR